MSRPRLEWGTWNAVCDVCGFRYKANEMKKRWDNLMVCPTDYELRNPQDLIRVRGDNPSVPWARPENDDTHIPVCYLWTETAFTGLGAAGCMQAGQTRNMTSQQVYALLNQPLPS